MAKVIIFSDHFRYGEGVRIRTALISAGLIGITIGGCSDSKLDQAVGDYNAQLEAVAESAHVLEKFAASLPYQPRSLWRDGAQVSALNKEGERAGGSLDDEIAKALRMRKALEQNPHLLERFRFTKFVPDSDALRFRLLKLNESPFRYLEKR